VPHDTLGVVGSQSGWLFIFVLYFRYSAISDMLVSLRALNP
jgi:hypothetical protein